MLHCTTSFFWLLSHVNGTNRCYRVCFILTFFIFDVHKNSPKQVTFTGQKCPLDVTQNVHEMSPKICPRNVPQKCPRNVTQKCPRNVTPFVHEKLPFMSTKCLPPFLQATQAVKVQFEIDKKYSSSNQIIQTRDFKNQLEMDRGFDTLGSTT